MKVELNPDNVYRAISQIALMAMLLRDHDLPAIIAEADRFNAFAPFFDPTAWIADHKNVATNKRMLEAALPLWEWSKKYEETYDNKN